MPCSLEPCENGGSCHNSTDYLSYTCDCPWNYTNYDCEMFIACSSAPCMNAGECVDYLDTDFDYRMVFIKCHVKYDSYLGAETQKSRFKTSF